MCRRRSGSMLSYYSPQRSHTVCTGFSVLRKSSVEKQAWLSLGILSLCFDSVWLYRWYGAIFHLWQNGRLSQIWSHSIRQTLTCMYTYHWSETIQWTHAYARARARTHAHTHTHTQLIPASNISMCSALVSSSSCFQTTPQSEPNTYVHHQYAIVLYSDVHKFNIQWTCRSS